MAWNVALITFSALLISEFKYMYLPIAIIVVSMYDMFLNIWEFVENTSKNSKFVAITGQLLRYVLQVTLWIFLIVQLFKRPDKYVKIALHVFIWGQLPIFVLQLWVDYLNYYETIF